jgi:hypothetical protein
MLSSLKVNSQRQSFFSGILIFFTYSGSIFYPLISIKRISFFQVHILIWIYSLSAMFSACCGLWSASAAKMRKTRWFLRFKNKVRKRLNSKKNRGKTGDHITGSFVEQKLIVWFYSEIITVNASHKWEDRVQRSNKCQRI